MYKDAKRWDNIIEQSLLESVISNANEAIVWGGNYYALPPCRGFLLWIKVPPMNTMADAEYAWTSFDFPSKAFTTHRHRDGKRTHPTTKPTTLMSFCIQECDRHNSAQTILDPFMGSGTTLLAAKDLGRKAVGIEIEEKYCEIAANRLSQEVMDLGV